VVCAAEAAVAWEAVTVLATADDAVCVAVGVVPCVNPREDMSFVGDIIFNRSKFDGDENGTPEGRLLGWDGVETGFKLKSLLAGEKGSPAFEVDSAESSLLLRSVVAAVAWGIGLGRP